MFHSSVERDFFTLIGSRTEFLDYFTVFCCLGWLLVCERISRFERMFFFQRGYLTYLLCGENGLCDSLDQVMSEFVESVQWKHEGFIVANISLNVVESKSITVEHYT